MDRPARFVGKTLLAIGLLCGPFLMVATAQQAAILAHPMIGEQAPAFALDTAGGGSLSLDQLRGQFVVLHFGASW